MQGSVLPNFGMGTKSVGKINTELIILSILPIRGTRLDTILQGTLSFFFFLNPDIQVDIYKDCFLNAFIKRLSYRET